MEMTEEEGRNLAWETGPSVPSDDTLEILKES